MTRHTAVRILLLALGVRLASAGIAYVANVSLPAFRPAREEQPDFARFRGFWSTFARYDAGWYVNIAQYGYVGSSDDGASNVAFFPVYPLTIRWVRHLMGGTLRPHHLAYYGAGLLVSWTCFPGALLLLYRLARLDIEERAAQRAVLYVSIFPFAFFFGEVYTESLFLLLTLASFYGFRTGRLVLGGLAGALACATRVNGIFALPALALVGWSATRQKERALPKLCGALALVAAGLGAYCLFVYWRTGNPFEWAASIERGWDYRPGGLPWSAYATLRRELLTPPRAYLAVDSTMPYDLLNGAAALLMVMAAPFVYVRFGMGYALFMLVNLWVPLSSGALEGLGRYSSVLFPFSLWISQHRQRALHTVTLIAFAMFYVLALAMFTLGYVLH